MANNVDISQDELDKIMSQRKPHVPTERERIQAEVHKKFQGLVTQDHIDAMMSGEISEKTETVAETADESDNHYGAISQEELDRLFRK